MQHHKQTQDGASYVVASQAKTSQVKAVKVNRTESVKFVAARANTEQSAPSCRGTSKHKMERAKLKRHKQTQIKRVKL